MGFLSSVSKLRGGNEYPDSSVARAVIMIMISSGSMAAEEALGYSLQDAVDQNEPVNSFLPSCMY